MSGSGALARALQRGWYGRHPLTDALRPLGWLFCALAGVRRAAYRAGLLRVLRPPVPLLVVGNITVGGSGKTPLVAWLAQRLAEEGLRVGLISRGYGGRSEHWPLLVGRDSDPAQVGDEPVLLVRRCGCPMAVGPDRVAALRRLLDAEPVDVVLADDGLQHYRLGRTVEVVVIDGERRLGNGRCLPAGPLREPPGRLHSADWVIANGAAQPGEVAMTLHPEAVRAVADTTRTRPLSAFRGPVHAVAGIGNPQRFFAMLRREGIEPIPHPFPDHHPFIARDIVFDDDLPVLMTEKDAVKCAGFADQRHWFVPVGAELPPEFSTALLQRLLRTTHE